MQDTVYGDIRPDGPGAGLTQGRQQIGDAQQVHVVGPAQQADGEEAVRHQHQEQEPARPGWALADDGVQQGLTLPDEAKAVSGPRPPQRACRPRRFRSMWVPEYPRT